MILNSPKQFTGLSGKHRAQYNVNLTSQLTLWAFCACPIFMGRDCLRRMSCTRSVVRRETTSHMSMKPQQPFGTITTCMIAQTCKSPAEAIMMLRALSGTDGRGALVPHHSRMDCTHEGLDMP